MKILLIACVILMSIGISFAQTESRKYGEFSEVNCEERAYHLDMFSIALRANPELRGYIIFYGGQRHFGKHMMSGEAQARAEAWRQYLILERSDSPDRIILVNGGYRENWAVELWLVLQGASPPVPKPTVDAQDIKFRRGRTNWKRYVCIF